MAFGFGPLVLIFVYLGFFVFGAVLLWKLVDAFTRIARAAEQLVEIFRRQTGT
jgi:hypothetical protein